MTNIRSIDSTSIASDAALCVGAEKVSKRSWRKRVAQKELQEMCRRAGMSHQAAFAFGWWPTLENACVELLMHLGGDRVSLDPGIPLSYTTIRSSVRAFDQGFEHTGKIDFAVRQFLDCFLSAADQLSIRKIYAEVGTQVFIWEPFRQSYDSWLQDIGAQASVKISSPNFIFDDELLAARRMLATLTLSKTDFILAFKSGD